VCRIASADFSQRISGANVVELSCRERNVLRRLLNRAEFKPQDIAQLGIARLESAEGLGVKGLTNVLDWLATNGYPLTPTSTRTGEDALRKDRINRRLAVLLLPSALFPVLLRIGMRNYRNGPRTRFPLNHEQPDQIDLPSE
jgi:hypothetical protein